ncbi:MAG: HAD hydrolase-like protein [Clostridiales bacterium]|nr:HAD hydrolase-like protein [Clostridiales bacterium]
MEEKVTHAIKRWKQRTGYDHLYVKAALIDMDGTLYNSMPNHTASWYRLATEMGIDCTRDEFYLYEGMTGAQTIKRLWQRQFGNVPDDVTIKELYHKKTLYFNELPLASVMPGAPALIAHLIAADVTTVLVTGSGQPSVLDRLDVEFKGAFPSHHRVTARNVTNGKPHPEPYLKGMHLAGVNPWEAIAIENAPIGVKSAADSGAFTIALTTGPVPEDTLAAAGADIIFPSMQSLALNIEGIINRH